MDKFCSVLEFMVYLEVLKSGPENVDNDAGIAPNVDCALYRAYTFNFGLLLDQQVSQKQSLWALKLWKLDHTIVERQ